MGGALFLVGVDTRVGFRPVEVNVGVVGGVV